MRRKRFSPEQITATLRQIEVHLAQGKNIALACKEAADYQFAWSKILVRSIHPIERAYSEFQARLTIWLITDPYVIPRFPTWRICL